MTASSKPVFCPSDPNSYANSHQAIIKHIHLNWHVDFVSKTISGWAEYLIQAVAEEGSSQIVMDVKGISIKNILLQDQNLKVRLQVLLYQMYTSILLRVLDIILIQILCSLSFLFYLLQPY